ncbi:MAG: hypothetical protein LBQ77_00055 [Treponema sp.]|jgi:hypothetical protein|nr:hypothetical protein [Treponema sp.]
MWKTVDIPKGQWYRWTLNGADFFLLREEISWKSAVAPIPFYRAQSGLSGPVESEAPVIQSRCIQKQASAITLQPHPSQKPYIVTLREELHIPAGAAILLSADIPFMLKVESNNGVLMTNVSPWITADTWFGENTMSGMICHCIPHSLHIATPTQAKSGWLRCICSLKNNSKHIFIVPPLMLPLSQTGVYEYNGQLCSDTVAFEFSGTDLELSTIQPPNSYDRTLVSGQKSDKVNMIIRQGADFIKNITRL